MYAKNCSADDLQRALDAINNQFDNNVCWEREPERRGNQLMFTLRTKQGRKAGSRLTHTGRHIPKACWHVHGEFFDALFEIAPDAVVKARDKIITASGGNWQDWNIGSHFQPMYYSEACECGR